MDFLITGNKTIQDVDQRILKYKQENLKLTVEYQRLKEKNLSPRKTIRRCLGGEGNIGEQIYNSYGFAFISHIKSFF